MSPVGHWMHWFHLLLGGFVITVRWSHSSTLLVAATLIATIMALTLGLSGLVLGPSAAKRSGVPELADPSDHLAHLTVGLLALWGWHNWNRRPMRNPGTPQRVHNAWLEHARGRAPWSSPLSERLHSARTPRKGVLRRCLAAQLTGVCCPVSWGGCIWRKPK